MTRRGRSARAALIALALLPIAVLLTRVGFQDWHPAGDAAVLALRVAEVGTSHTPLVGPYSRFGWAHPGPMLAYSLALPYRVLGNRGLLVGSLAISGLSVFILVRTLLRAGGRGAAVLGASCVGIAVFSVGASMVWFPWNPTITLLPFAAFLALTWSVSLGWCWDVAWFAGFASLLVQSHVGYAPIVVGAGGAAAIGAWASRAAPLPESDASNSTVGRWRRPLIVAAVVTAVAWIPPALDAIAHDGGNLRALADFWTSDHHALGVDGALRITSLALSARAPWVGFDAPIGLLGEEAPRGWPIPIALVLLVAALVVAIRRRDRVARNLCAVMLVTIAISMLSIARIVGEPLHYLLHWTTIVAAMTWFASGWTLARALVAVRPNLRRAAWTTVAIGACAVVAIATVATLRAGVGTSDDQKMSDALGVVLPKVRHAVADAPEPIAVDGKANFFSTLYQSGILLDLVQTGHDVTAPTRDALYYGDHYASGANPATSLGVVASTLGIEARRERGDVAIAQSGPLLPAPTHLPARRPGETVDEYVDRVSHRSLAMSLRLLPWRANPLPVAVFPGPGAG